MQPQDLSKEQLSHFSTAKVVGICFSHSTFFKKKKKMYIFANCKWNSNPWEFELISRFGIYITQVCLKHAKIIFSIALGSPRGSKTRRLPGTEKYLNILLLNILFLPIVLVISVPQP